MQVRRDVVLAADRRRVWAALCDPGELGAWFGAEVELDTRVGGRATFRWPDGAVDRAVVRELRPGERLVWSCDGSVVELDLVALDDGRCRLTVTETAGGALRVPVGFTAAGVGGAP